MKISIPSISQILFLDIETVSGESNWNDLDPILKTEWIKKCQRQFRVDESLASNYYHERAGIYAEFGKIVCISIAAIRIKRGVLQTVRIKSFCQAKESDLLKSFCQFIVKHYNQPEIHGFCGHNIREFDIPYIVRRFLVHEINVPKVFRISMKKTWENKHILDTLDLWRFGDYKNYTSLQLLCCILNIPSPKSDIDGSQVSAVYWKDDDLDRIVEYCERDVRALIRVFLRLLSVHKPELNLLNTDALR